MKISFHISDRNFCIILEDKNGNTVEYQGPIQYTIDQPADPGRYEEITAESDTSVATFDDDFDFKG